MPVRDVPGDANMPVRDVPGDANMPVRDVPGVSVREAIAERERDAGETTMLAKLRC